MSFLYCSWQYSHAKVVKIESLFKLHINEYRQDMRRLNMIIFICLLGYGLSAQVKYSNEFLNIGVGAASMGMGGAGIASVNNVTAGYWNPANLISVRTKFDASLMHSEYFAGLAKYDYGALSYKIDDISSAAVSIIRLGVDDIPNTLELIDADGNMRYDRIKSFSSSDLALLLSYSRRLPLDGLSVGGSAKIINRRTGEFASAWGFGFDAAIGYISNGWQFAGVIRDVTTTFNAWRINTDQLDEVFAITGNEIPENSLEITVPRVIIGASKAFTISQDLVSRVNLDLHFTLDGKRPVLLSTGFTGIDPYAGSEWIYKDWLSFRFGVGQFQWVPGLEGKNELTLLPAMGIGIRYKNIFIDYALTDVGDLAIAQYSNVISLRFGFGA